MSRAGEQSVIHRKAAVARDEFDAREMSPAKALRLALSRAGETLHGLALRVRTIEQEVTQLDAVEAAVGDDGLLILLDGKEGERGAIKLDLQFLAGLIEVQLMGKLRPAPAPPRAFTQTDAAIAEPLMNALLAGADADLTEAGLPEIASGLGFGDRIEEGRMLALALSAPEYDLYRLTVDMDEGAKTGVLTLLLPQRPAPGGAAAEEEDRSLQAKLEENALNAPVMLDAVLARLRLPLNKICDWRPGTVLPLAPDALNTARLACATGHQVTRVKLGQMNGFRAVRLMLDPGADDSATPGADRAEPRSAETDMLAPVDSGDEEAESWAQVADEAARQLTSETAEGGDPPSGGWRDPAETGPPRLPDMPEDQGQDER